MNRKIGFTLIELLITITIVVVLLTLTVVSLRNSQATARDEERKTDVAAIAQNLENYYQSGSSASAPSNNATLASATSSSPSAKLAVISPFYPPGRYPPTAYMANETEIKKTLQDIDPAVLRAPDVATSSPVSLVVATNTAEPSPNISTYVYQPLKSDGTLCTTGGSGGGDECRKFTLYYKLETDSAVQKITSKHQ